MLDLALEFIRDELNGFITARTGSPVDTVVLSRFPGTGGATYGFDEDKLGMTVINLEEERTARTQLPTHAYVNGQHVVREPDVKINVHTLIGANYKQYDEALKFISLVILFFQSHPSFTPTEYPAMDPSIERLVVELQSPTYEQLNQIWGFVGTKQLPSVIYRIRMVVLQDTEPSQSRPPLTSVTTTMSGR
jgi:hypothetical protein